MAIFARSALKILQSLVCGFVTNASDLTMDQTVLLVMVLEMVGVIVKHWTVQSVNVKVRMMPAKS